ncbi:MAG: MFS transporter [Gemmatimonadaceae bacterium]
MNPPNTSREGIRGQRPNRWWLVVASGLAVFMGMLDTSVVNVALPVIERGFGTRTSLSQWVVLGYLLPLIALALPSGRWLDRGGHRPAMVGSTLGFVTASVAAGLAPNIGSLIAARVVQGAFAAVLFSVSTVLTTTAVQPAARGRAMGVITTLGPLGAVCGPVVGGVLVDRLGWPWIFYLNAPIGLAIAGLAFAQLTADEPLRLPDRWLLAETLLLAAAGSITMLALSLGASHGGAWSAAALVALLPLAVWLHLPVSVPVRRLFRVAGVAAPHVGLLATAVATGAVMLLLPFYLEQRLRMSAGAAGATILAYPLAMAVVGLAAGVLADRFGAKRIGIIGGSMQAIGLLLLAPLGARWSRGDVLWRLALLGLGNGLFMAPNMTLVMSATPRDQFGTTSGTTGAIRQLGFALGPAFSTALWAASGYQTTGMRHALAAATAVAAFGAAALAWANADRDRIQAVDARGGRSEPTTHMSSRSLAARATGARSGSPSA